MAFDPLTATCQDLQNLLETHTTTSVDIIETYLSQINKFDKTGICLNAMIAVAPRHLLLAQAISLDEERFNGKVRGPLHGLPVILKVTFFSQLSMIGSDM
jgi:amidase